MFEDLNVWMFECLCPSVFIDWTYFAREELIMEFFWKTA
jgi:hypothetical protein